MPSQIKMLIIVTIILQSLSFPVIAQKIERPGLEVHFIDVGQGDSILIQTPQGKSILIDGGPPNAGKKVTAYLEARRVKKIDLLIATHPDIDHIGGLVHVMKSFPIDRMIDSGKSHITMTYAKYLNQIRQQNIPLTTAKFNEKIEIDQLIDIEILNAYQKGKNTNQSSIVLNIIYDDFSLLLMGDAERPQEYELIDKFNVKSDILKIGHHGSKTSTSFEFLKQVNPDLAIITYSKHNKYGHPVNHVIANLNRLNIDIYSTGAYGDIVIYTDGKGYYVIPEKLPTHGLTS